MNHKRVTLRCGRCDRASVVIIEGAHYCSSHALTVTLARVGGPGLVVDLRGREPVVDLTTAAGAASPPDPRAHATAV